MKQLVLPIKDSNILHKVEDTLLNNFKAGRRSYTIFQVGKATLLRVSDVLVLRRTEIFNDDETVVKNAYIRDKKTGRPNILGSTILSTDGFNISAYFGLNLK